MYANMFQRIFCASLNMCFEEVHLICCHEHNTRSATPMGGKVK